jgi:hypothetical protein
MCIIATDPYGNRVNLPKKLLPVDLLPDKNRAIYDSPDQVIQRPAILLTNCKEPQPSPTEPCENHYYRSIGWEHTLLISARKEEGRWTAYRCICNPSVKQLAQLFRVTRQLCLLYVVDALIPFLSRSVPG